VRRAALLGLAGGALAGLALAACGGAEQRELLPADAPIAPAAAPATTAPTPREKLPPAGAFRPAVRPHEPFVFRSVLDGVPRALTVALQEWLWISYDTTTGTLTKAWAGGVHFDGPVYTSVHGPQPTSTGTDLLDPLAGARWRVRPAGRGDTWVDAESVRYGGYRLQDGGVVLLWNIQVPGGPELRVEEHPEIGSVEPTPLVRSFRVADAPPDVQLALVAEDRPVAVLEHRVETDGVYEAARIVDIHDGTGAPEHVRVRLLLAPTGETTVRVGHDLATVQRHEDAAQQERRQAEKRAAAAEREAEAAEREAEAGRPAQAAASDESAAGDADGAAGDVDGAAGALRAEASAPEQVVSPEPLPSAPRATEPGLALRIYEVQGGMTKLLPLVPGQTPNVSVLVPELDLVGDDGDFSALAPEHEPALDGDEDPRFLAIVTGFLRIVTPGAYRLRLLSDDGSRLWLGSTLVVDHDGLHGPEPKDGAVRLQAGTYALRIEHFENGGGERLALLWNPPDAGGFSVVPPDVLACPAGEVRVTSPGPKAVVRPLPRGRPGDGLPLDAVHPAFDLQTVRPADFEPAVGGLDVLPDGRLVLCTWDKDGAVWILSGVDGEDRGAITARRYAAGLAEPLGLTLVDGRLYVLQKQELTELIDRDADGTVDEYRCVAAGWPVSANFHEFAFGLAYADGAFWANLAVAIDPGGRSTDPQVPGRGSVLRIEPDGAYCAVADGLRAPNGIGFGAGGDLYLTDNQGDWLPVSKLLRVVEGAFYGNHSVHAQAEESRPVTPPVVWLPQGEIGNSPSQPVPLDIGPWAGQMLHGDVTHGGLKRVFVEEVDGVAQGAVFRFSQGFEAGINRLAWGPMRGSTAAGAGARGDVRSDVQIDVQSDARGDPPGVGRDLYIGGIGSTGNWGQEGKARFGLQRLRYTGRPVFEILAVRAMSDGLELQFTEPLASPSAAPLGGHAGWDPADWSVEQWRYEPTAEYGGEKLDERELLVTSASVLDEGRRVFLALDGMAPGHVLRVRAISGLRSAAGRALWSTEAWYTLNRIPVDRPGRRAEPPPGALFAPNTLTDAQRADGWRLLFDGESSAGWRGFRQETLPDGWEVQDGALVRSGPGGDIVTEEQFTDFELSLEWKLEPGGNSGLFFHVTEDKDWVWETGPEMQVLDNVLHADGANPATSAGANYALHAPAWDTTRPIGRWNRARLLVVGPHVEHWLNGEKLLEYELGSEDWTARVAASKFASMPEYGLRRTGHIALQDHGDRVAYRNIRIREIAGR
jgi:cytochrome c